MSSKLPKMLSVTLFSILLGCFTVNAETLAKLKTNLEALNADTELNVQFNASFIENEGKDDEAKTKSGNISYSVLYNDDGLQITYPKDVVAQITAENKLAEKDEEADTPTLNAMRKVQSTQILENLSAAQPLLDLINKGNLVSEEILNIGKDELIELRFELPMEKMITSKKLKKYVDEFEGLLVVTVDALGYPISSHFNIQGKGTAYVFFDMQVMQSKTAKYQVFDQRLVQVFESFQLKQSSTFGGSESNGEKSITFLDEAPIKTALN